MLASKELSDRLHAVVWLANEAHAGNKEAETLLAGARFGADPTVAAEVEAFFAAQAARGLSEVD